MESQNKTESKRHKRNRQKAWLEGPVQNKIKTENKSESKDLTERKIKTESKNKTES